jgi:hypothetical protein
MKLSKDFTTVRMAGLPQDKMVVDGSVQIEYKRYPVQSKVQLHFGWSSQGLWSKDINDIKNLPSHYFDSWHKLIKQITPGLLSEPFRILDLMTPAPSHASKQDVNDLNTKLLNLCIEEIPQLMTAKLLHKTSFSVMLELDFNPSEVDYRPNETIPEDFYAM